ncbi:MULTISPECIES: SulP family inorganic anion transporter [Sulfitobacter]|uniref:SulP family inorganic anion transporter n=1 Tax=Sulfitobacter TaxID=60136 RepID=UPI0023071F23|nr:MULTISPECIES: sulfate permease [Sulfitobacter]MDF3383239.1 sulfate permease [Sulfitobacter sp. Ks11]MDF3386658.1 sulfate permease [Sulfitobacter sp. M85]MDF3390077.1 sulfate permease [Sulfitobacter sp. Ks16]MDF3400714.1 sulfate permease [Sulfitobacter sp. KE39]MDF3404135.1 sulfate permease [Sulfitobacter sp. Ks35]
MPLPSLSHYLPILDWGRRYDRGQFTGDMIAAVIVTIMLIPQSLAYALLAGMPPEAGIYASIAPIVLYAIFGTSRALAVGPVAVVSLMTAAAVGEIAQSGTAGYVTAALTLAFLSGAMLLALGLFRLGFLANFLSHPVIAGFITASGILIAASQLRHILGIEAEGHTLPQILSSLWAHLGEVNVITLGLGLAATAFLFWVRGGLKPLLRRMGLGPRMADIGAKTGPVLAILATTLAVWGFDLGARGVAIVGEVPQSLPPLNLPSFSPELLSQLFVPALLISVIGFVESISVAQTLAAKKRQRIDPDQELIGLGSANLGAAFTGGFPVTGGFSRSVVNFDAGAETPAAGAFTAAGLALAALFLTPLIYFLPKATLAATIIVAVLSLVDFSILKRAWAFSHADFAAVSVTILLTLIFGVEAGVSAGVVTSILVHLYKTSRPHMAVVGRVPGTEHFRNVLRHEVETQSHVLSLRVDESLYFPNARFLEDQLAQYAADKPDLTDVVLMFPAVNEIDLSALESLEAINTRLKDADIRLHLSEVKGPVMDRLKRSHFLDELTGEVFLSQHEAACALANTPGDAAG